MSRLSILYSASQDGETAHGVKCLCAQATQLLACAKKAWQCRPLWWWSDAGAHALHACTWLHDPWAVTARVQQLMLMHASCADAPVLRDAWYAAAWNARCCCAGHAVPPQLLLARGCWQSRRGVQPKLKAPHHCLCCCCRHPPSAFRVGCCCCGQASCAVSGCRHCSTGAAHLAACCVVGGPAWSIRPPPTRANEVPAADSSSRALRITAMRPGCFTCRRRSVGARGRRGLCAMERAAGAAGAWERSVGARGRCAIQRAEGTLRLAVLTKCGADSVGFWK